MTPAERTLLRDLAKRYAAVAADPAMDRRRAAWRRHNSLKSGRPLIYVRAVAWHELPESKCQLADPFWQHYENFLRHRLYWSTLNDDSIFEPWLTLPAVQACEGWGVGRVVHHSAEPGGAYKIDYPIRELNDIRKLRRPWHAIDERKTDGRRAQLQEVLGDILAIHVDRAPAYRMFNGDLSTELGRLRGIENIMLDMTDNPDGLKQLVSFLSDGVLQVHDEAAGGGTGDGF